MSADRDPDRSRDAREQNPLGLGPRDPESSNTGSIEDTAYDAVASDPYTTGEPRKDTEASSTDPGTPADPETSSSEEP